ncbi:bifunctional DNA primase/polymerase [Streptomyces sp. NPDC047009]|uniref:bifunctional DNA primase/polymerase n=1 Tax=Streptomyces sp. NPDC047009 TaxID=3154496 RepID=UPI0033F5AE60
MAHPFPGGSEGSPPPSRRWTPPQRRYGAPESQRSNSGGNDAQGGAQRLHDPLWGEPLHVPPDLPLPDAALLYARAGIRVFRIRRNKVPFGNCRLCDRNGTGPTKGAFYIPHTPQECRCGVDTCHAHHAATTDLATIERWWTEEPDSNIAAPCRLNGWAGIDVDPRNGGDISYALIEREYGVLPGTTLQVTGGGGFHALYRAPNFAPPGKFGIGIEVKFNGYVLLAPSVNSSGGQYRWINDLFFHPVVPWPRQLTPLSELPKSERPSVPSAHLTVSHTDGLERVRMKCQEITQVDYGNAATDVWRLSLHVGQYVAERQVSEETAWELLSHALDGWTYAKYADEKNMTQQLHNGFQAGLGQPRDEWVQR